MSLSVALYAEGAGETLGTRSLLPAPGETLYEEHLGAAHVLVRRIMSKERSIPENAVRFVAPLRSSRGPHARGSMLHAPKILRQLLTWPVADRRPDLAVVLVDQDDVTQRKRDISEATADLLVAHVIAVAIKEFEAWLLADSAALIALVGPVDALPPAPEQLECGAAKQRLAALAASWVTTHDGHDFRRSIAATCDLVTVIARCRSFSLFCSDARTS